MSIPRFKEHQNRQLRDPARGRRSSVSRFTLIKLAPFDVGRTQIGINQTFTIEDRTLEFRPSRISTFQVGATRIRVRQFRSLGTFTLLQATEKRVSRRLREFTGRIEHSFR